MCNRNLCWKLALGLRKLYWWQVSAIIESVTAWQKKKTTNLKGKRKNRLMPNELLHKHAKELRHHVVMTTIKCTERNMEYDKTLPHKQSAKKHENPSVWRAYAEFSNKFRGSWWDLKWDCNLGDMVWDLIFFTSSSPEMWPQRDSKGISKRTITTKWRGVQYLLDKYCKSLVFEWLREVDMISAFWVDSERCNDHVRFLVDHFTDHAVPLFTVTAVSLQKGQTSMLKNWYRSSCDIDMFLCMIWVKKPWMTHFK